MFFGFKFFRSGKSIDNILLIDDNVAVNHLHKSMLRQMHDFDRIETCISGIEAYKLFDKGFVPEMILLDIAMPNMDGFSFLERLEKEYPALKPKILMVTNLKKDEYEEKMQKTSYDFEIKSKPIATSDILMVLDS